MNKSLLQKAFGIVLGICAIAVPGYCGTVLQFVTPTTGGTTGSSGTITGTGTSESLTALSGISISQIVITGDTIDSNDNGTWTVSGGTLKLGTNGTSIVVDGTIGSCTAGTCFTSGLGNLSGLGGASVALETLNYSSMTEGSGLFTASGGTSTITYGTPTSISELTALANDLSGFSAGASTTQNNSFTQGAIISTDAAPVGSGATQTVAISPYSVTNLEVTLNSVTATPEPTSLLLFGGGLLGVAWFARRRSVQN